MWSKDTNWRQCSIIDIEVLRNYNPGLVGGISEGTTHLCAISCDGDIVNDNLMMEPVVEFLGAKCIAETAPEYSYAKHPSILHLPCFLAGDPVVLELKASPKLEISKHNLIPAIQPDKKFFFEENSRTILRSWLSFRYRRQELPRSFLARTLPLWTYLRKEGKKHASHVLGYWLDYDPRGGEVPALIPYGFSLYIVYSHRQEGAKEEAEILEREIRERFPQWQEEAFNTTGEVDLVECKAYAEDCFTLADLCRCVHFDLEQINGFED